MKVDVIMLSLSKDEKIHNMTQNAINTLHSSENKHKFNVILLESIKDQKVEYSGCTVMYPDFEFNYNKFMNFGLSRCNSKYVALCNNDLIFHKNWFSEIYKHKDIADSFSPWNNSGNCWHPEYKKTYEEEFLPGYEIGFHISGWCIVAKRKIFDTIELDERVSFWYSDKVYSDALQRKDIPHILVLNSYVDHLESVTLDQMPQNVKSALTGQQGEIYHNKISKENEIPA